MNIPTPWNWIIMIWDRKRISFEHVPTLMKIEAQTSCWIINYMIDRVIPPTSDIYFSLRLLNPCLNCKIKLRNTGKRNFQTIKLDLAIKWSALNALKAWRFTVKMFFFLSEMQILKTVEFCVKNCLNIFKRVSVSANRHEKKPPALFRCYRDQFNVHSLLILCGRRQKKCTHRSTTELRVDTETEQRKLLLKYFQSLLWDYLIHNVIKMYTRKAIWRYSLVYGISLWYIFIYE